MAEDLFAKRKRLTDEAMGMADADVPRKAATPAPTVKAARPDPTFDNPRAHGPTAPIPSGGMGGLAPKQAPPPAAGRKTFGVSEGDQ